MKQVDAHLKWRPTQKCSRAATYSRLESMEVKLGSDRFKFLKLSISILHRMVESKHFEDQRQKQHHPNWQLPYIYSQPKKKLMLLYQTLKKSTKEALHY